MKLNSYKFFVEVYWKFSLGHTMLVYVVTEIVYSKNMVKLCKYGNKNMVSIAKPWLIFIRCLMIISVLLEKVANLCMY